VERGKGTLHILGTKRRKGGIEGPERRRAKDGAEKGRTKFGMESIGAGLELSRVVGGVGNLSIRPKGLMLLKRGQGAMIFYNYRLGTRVNFLHRLRPRITWSCRGGNQTAREARRDGEVSRTVGGGC